MNERLNGTPTYEQLQYYFAEATFLLEDCPKEKKLAKEVSTFAKSWCEKIYISTEDKKFWELYWDIMKWESRPWLDSYMLYIERNRPANERFYLPRRKSLSTIVNGYQRLEDNELDVLFAHMPPRVGKLISDDTDVMTKDGWKKHGDLRVGDYVVGSDGKYTKVVAVHPKHHTTHTVTISDGTKIECHENHEWTVFDKNKGKYRTIETSEFVGNLTMREGNTSRSRFYLPIRPVFEGIHKNLAVHPYVFGAWIGDGTTRNPCITEPEEDFAIMERIAECGYPIMNVKHCEHSKVAVVSFKGLRSDLQKYGLCNRNDTDTKYIPQEYLEASVEQRLQLLAGLLDTDGYYNRKERRYELSTCYEHIKCAVVDLINSFGWYPCVSEVQPKLNKTPINGKPIHGRRLVYRISFVPDMPIPCVLKRKQADYCSKKKRYTIVGIQESVHKQGNCITVENADGIYLVTKSMIPTHNSQVATEAMNWHINRNTELANLYVTYKDSLGGAFLDGCIEMMTDPTYLHQEIFPEFKIADTDAKAHKLDLGRKKKYKTLSGKGLESGLNGEYDANGWMLIDDILEGIQDVLNPDVLRRKQIVFDNNVMSRKKEHCKVIINGTIWSLHDIYSNYLNFIQSDPSSKDLRVDILKIPALNENDESNFEYDYGVGFSTKYYQMTRAKFEANDDMASWFAQYQQEPIERDGAVFNPEHMQFYNGILPNEEPIRIFSACDVALGGADYLSMPIAYMYADGSTYVHDVVFDNSEKDITQQEVIDAIIRNNVGSAFFEANQGGEGYKDDINRLLKEKGYKANITSKYAPTNKRKEQRIWDKAPEIRQLYFRDDTCRDPQYRKFMTNLYSFTINRKVKNDDAPDSLAMLIDFKDGTGVRVARIMSSPI